jgi:hypothetical protein
MVRCFIVIDLDAANHAGANTGDIAGSNTGDVGGENTGGSTGADSEAHAGVSLFLMFAAITCVC